MPIKIERYFTAAHDIWQQEKSGKRFVARCKSKSIAARIVKLLNAELERSKQALGKNQ